MDIKFQRYGSGRLFFQRERGAVLFMGIGFMMLAILSLALVVDTGRLYITKRNLQRVADMAAIEVLSRGGKCTDSTALQYAQQSLSRNSFVLSAGKTVSVTCGQVATTAGLRDLIASPSGALDTAVRVVVRESTPGSLIAGGFFKDNIVMEASAIATNSGSGLAFLTLKSTLLNVNITQNSRAELLSNIFGGMLGGSLNISVGAWNGLIHTDIDIFKFLNQLAINSGLSAGSYNEVLTADVSTGELIQAAIDVLESQNGTPQSTINALDAIVALDELLVASQIAPTDLNVGELIRLQSVSSYTGAAANLQLFHLVQGIIQLANKHNAVTASVPITVGGTTIDVKLKVIEPPQLSSIGDPELARAESYLPPNDSPNRIYVRSAQVRMLMSVNLSSTLTSLVSNLQSTLNSVLSPLTTLLNNVLSLNLNEILGTVLCFGCTQTFVDPIILPPTFRLDVNLDVGAGEARVNDYACDLDRKSLMVNTKTAATNLRIGSMGTSAANAQSLVFASTSAPTVNPIALIDIGKKQCTVTCILGICSTSNCVRTAYAGGGVGLKADVPVAQTTTLLTYQTPAASNLPELYEAPAFQSVSSQNIINSLTSTLAGPTIEMYAPSGSGNGLGNLLVGAGTTMDGVIALLKQAVSTVLSPILDPLVTMLVNNLGIDLAKTDVGATMSCGSSGGVKLIR
jgi:uncharacterized membrane protein